MIQSNRFSPHFGARLLRLWACLVLAAAVMGLHPAPAQAANLPKIPQLSQAALTGSWQAMPHGGLNGSVRAMLAVGNDLYVGGFFSATADGKVTDLNNIAKFSGGAWSALTHNGLNDGVLALAYNNGSLYLGGRFYKTADSAVTGLTYIAAYKISTSAWSVLPNGGLNNYVMALAFMNNTLYAGGEFAKTADGTVVNLNNIARLDAGWSALPNQGLDGEVWALTVMGGKLYAAGEFLDTFDHTGDHLYMLARLNGSAWQTLGLGPAFDAVYALHTVGNDLYVGGHFSGPCGSNITRYLSGTCAGFPNLGLNYRVRGLAVIGGEVFAAGDFTTSYDLTVPNLTHIAFYHDGVWTALPGNGFNGSTVSTLLVMNGFLYAGGTFNATADGLVSGLSNIARFSIPPPFKIYLPGIMHQ